MTDNYNDNDNTNEMKLYYTKKKYNELNELRKQYYSNYYSDKAYLQNLKRNNNNNCNVTGNLGFDSLQKSYLTDYYYTVVLLSNNNPANSVMNTINNEVVIINKNLLSVLYNNNNKFQCYLDNSENSLILLSRLETELKLLSVCLRNILKRYHSNKQYSDSTLFVDNKITKAITEFFVSVLIDNNSIKENLNIHTIIENVLCINCSINSNNKTSVSSKEIKEMVHSILENLFLIVLKYLNDDEIGLFNSDINNREKSVSNLFCLTRLNSSACMLCIKTVIDSLCLCFTVKTKSNSSSSNSYVKSDLEKTISDKLELLNILLSIIIVVNSNHTNVNDNSNNDNLIIIKDLMLYIINTNIVYYLLDQINSNTNSQKAIITSIIVINNLLFLSNNIIDHDFENNNKSSINDIHNDSTLLLSIIKDFYSKEKLINNINRFINIYKNQLLMKSEIHFFLQFILNMLVINQNSVTFFFFIREIIKSDNNKGKSEKGNLTIDDFFTISKNNNMNVETSVNSFKVLRNYDYIDSKNKDYYGGNKKTDIDVEENSLFLSILIDNTCCYYSIDIISFIIKSLIKYFDDDENSNNSSNRKNSSHNDRGNSIECLSRIVDSIMICSFKIIRKINDLLVKSSFFHKNNHCNGSVSNGGNRKDDDRNSLLSSYINLIYILFLISNYNKNTNKTISNNNNIKSYIINIAISLLAEFSHPQIIEKLIRRVDDNKESIINKNPRIVFQMIYVILSITLNNSNNSNYLVSDMTVSSMKEIINYYYFVISSNPCCFIANLEDCLLLFDFIILLNNKYSSDIRNNCHLLIDKINIEKRNLDELMSYIRNNNSNDNCDDIKKFNIRKLVFNTTMNLCSIIKTFFNNDN